MIDQKALAALRKPQHMARYLAPSCPARSSDPSRGLVWDHLGQ
jgi:hypothetical protein